MRKCEVKFYLWMLFLTHTWNISDGYRNIRLQDYLCADKLIIALQKPFRGDPAMTLMEDRDSGAIITQIWNTTLPGVYSSNKIKYDCHFRVQTPQRPPRGIYTIITRLKFRRHPKSSECLDFIQFSSGNRSPSERICNDISIDGPSGRLIFDQRDRDINVHIHIDKRHMIVEPLELRMVLTAHSECLNSNDFLCDPKDQYSCISRYFLRDNITNCMYPCRDEVACWHDAITAEEIDTTNVALSALTSLIFTMLGVGLCVWICWKYWNCITVEQHAREASEAASRSRGPLDVPSMEVSPTAPAVDDITAGLEHHYNQYYQHQQQPQQAQHQPRLQQPPTPKDLPPSYESLFPE